MTQKTLKYRMLLKAFRMLPVKRIMAGTPEKTQKIFKKAYKGVEIPELHDPEISVSRGEVKGQAVLYYRHRKETDRVGIYLVGGGMAATSDLAVSVGMVWRVAKSIAVPMIAGFIICDLFVTVAWIGMIWKGMLPLKKAALICTPLIMLALGQLTNFIMEGLDSGAESFGWLTLYLVCALSLVGKEEKV